jgi:ABC-type hemin transport system ATPase subunit
MLLMDEGRVAAEGSPEEVLREETLRDVYHWPMSVRLDGETGHLRVTPLDGLAGSH